MSAFLLSHRIQSWGRVPRRTFREYSWKRETNIIDNLDHRSKLSINVWYSMCMNFEKIGAETMGLHMLEMLPLTRGMEHNQSNTAHLFINTYYTDMADVTKKKGNSILPEHIGSCPVFTGNYNDETKFTSYRGKKLNRGRQSLTHFNLVCSSLNVSA